jgi:hypothetical protein
MMHDSRINTKDLVVTKITLSAVKDSMAEPAGTTTHINIA